MDQTQTRLGDRPGDAPPSLWRPTSPRGVRRLADHVRAHYSTDVRQVAELAANVFRVDLVSGETWVVRLFGPARPPTQVEGDAALLGYLEEHDFPAERCAHADPVSEVDGHTALVTTFVDGVAASQTPRELHALGALHGRLHTLPANEVVARDGGAYHGVSPAGGSRRADVATLLPLLDDLKSVVPAEQRPLCDALIRELHRVDFCDDLPNRLGHIDFGGPNVIATENGPVAIDWTGAGQMPRVFSLVPLTFARDSRDNVDAFVDGYRGHSDLEPAELDRLGVALWIHGLVLNCLVAIAAPARLPRVTDGLAQRRQGCEESAALVRAAFNTGRAHV